MIGNFIAHHDFDGRIYHEHFPRFWNGVDLLFVALSLRGNNFVQDIFVVFRKFMDRAVAVEDSKSLFNACMVSY